MRLSVCSGGCRVSRGRGGGGLVHIVPFSDMRLVVIQLFWLGIFV